MISPLRSTTPRLTTLAGPGRRSDSLGRPLRHSPHPALTQDEERFHRSARHLVPHRLRAHGWCGRRCDGGRRLARWGARPHGAFCSREGTSGRDLTLSWLRRASWRETSSHGRSEWPGRRWASVPTMHSRALFPFRAGKASLTAFGEQHRPRRTRLPHRDPCI